MTAIRTFACLLPALLTATGLLAVEVDPDLPQPFDPSSVVQGLSGRSPFNRVVDFSNSYQLTGLAYVNGQPIATLLNKETKQHFVVSNEVNNLGWKLTEAVPSSAPGDTAVKIQVGGELVTLHYTAPETKGSATTSSGRSYHPTGPVDYSKLTEADYIRKDENGKEYVRGSIYLDEKSRERYYTKDGISPEARDKFREVIRDSRDKMFQMSHEQRAAFTQKVFNAIDSKYPVKR